ncbi:MAG: NfeD family protein, partial [Lentisphaeria bacterium]|nr:NfeD family protein [Lentisphaeria bacterium]
GLVVLAAIVCGYAFKGPTWGTFLLLISGVSGLIGFWCWIRYFPRTPVGRRLILENDARDWHGTDQGKRELAGKEGMAHTTLRPAGTAIIDGQRIDVVTRGEMIAANTPVRVVKVEGNRVVVTAVE